MLQFPTWKRTLVLVVCALGLLYAAPNFVANETALWIQSWMPDGGPGKQLSLGLDLQGGAYLLLEVKAEGVVVERLDANIDAVRGALRDARVRYRPAPHIQGNEIVFRILEPERLAEIEALMRSVDPDMVVEAAEDGTFRMRFTEQAAIEIQRRAVGQSIEIVRRRIDETGTREPLIQRQGHNRILVQLPGVEDPERIKDLLRKTAKLTFRFVSDKMSVEEARQRGAPPGYEIVPSADEFQRDYLLERRVIVSGGNLVDAQPSFDENNQPAVSFRFDAVGGQKFGKATQDNVGRLFAIVLDGKVISAPRIRTAILGGSGIITGNFTTQSAADLALLLRAGALPADLVVIEERSVGPGLGRDSIRAGKIASVVGLIAVVVFMAIAYGLFGVLADVALLFNIVLIIAALSALQATLTLPGIAGIVLTIGMAVDANVLIFERIREEVRAGRSPLNAVDAGYKRALTTIIDANLTTLIAASLLFMFGSGPVKGFAVTLMIGIVTSMFTAIMVTRLMVATWLRRRRPAELPI
ncbi:MAG: protein translocase subunit SecD [Alphaproteobacteria bacterium]|nr:protein translocase subunit SecD [Alphaproteobacteria bacterium]